MGAASRSSRDIRPSRAGHRTHPSLRGGRFRSRRPRACKATRTAPIDASSVTGVMRDWRAPAQASARAGRRGPRSAAMQASGKTKLNQAAMLTGRSPPVKPEVPRMTPGATKPSSVP